MTLLAHLSGLLTSGTWNLDWARMKSSSVLNGANSMLLLLMSLSNLQKMKMQTKLFLNSHIVCMY